MFLNGSLFRLFFLLQPDAGIGSVVEHVLAVQFSAGGSNSLLNNLARRFEELSLTHLDLALQVLALDVRDEERRNQFLYDDFRLVLALFDSVQEVVDSSHLQLRFLVSLE